MKTPLPHNEDLRLADLISCQILDTPPEKEFDDLVELIAHISGCPSATISFIDRDRQWFKSRVGIELPEMPREVTFCTHTILDEKVLLVEDATKDPRFAANPVVSGESGVRFYAGAPIVSSTGCNLGTVCVFDNQPHQFNETQQRSLAIVAAQVTKLLELRIRNLLIREQAREQIDIEKKTVQYTLRQQDEERQSIGIQLHENFAQVLTACSLYLNMAEDLNGGGHPLVSKARTELARLIDDIRLLSRRVNPISVHEVDFRDVLTESVEAVSRQAPFQTRLSIEGSSSHLPPQYAVTLLRAIVQYLEVLRSKKEISLVTVRLLIGQRVRLTIRYEASQSPEFSLFERVTVNALLNRVESAQGTIRFQDNGIDVELPEPRELVN